MLWQLSYRAAQKSFDTGCWTSWLQHQVAFAPSCILEIRTRIKILHKDKCIICRCIYSFCGINRGTTLTNRNSIQEEIKSRLKSENACCYSVQNILSSSLLSKNIKIKIYRTIILLLFFMGVKLGRSRWTRNVGWGCLRIGCWGEYLGLRRRRQQGNGENYTMRHLMICTPHPIFFRWSNWEEWAGQGMLHVWGRGEVYSAFW